MGQKLKKRKCMCKKIICTSLGLSFLPIENPKIYRNTPYANLWLTRTKLIFRSAQELSCLKTNTYNLFVYGELWIDNFEFSSKRSFGVLSTFTSTGTHIAALSKSSFTRSSPILSVLNNKSGLETISTTKIARWPRAPLAISGICKNSYIIYH